MTQARRVRLSAMQRVDLWRRWKAGQSLHEIGRAFGKSHVSIQFVLSQHGGTVETARSSRTGQCAHGAGEHRKGVTKSYGERL